MLRNIIFQAFTEPLKNIMNNLYLIKDQGFNTIQISPLQGTKEDTHKNKDNWWTLYQPVNYHIGNILGTKEELKELCEKAHKLDIKVIVDVVFHHIANERYNDVSHIVDKEILNIQDLWYGKDSFKDITDYNNDWSCSHNSLGGLPALNLSNLDLRRLQFNYLIELRECGVDGCRLDAMRHLASENLYFEYMQEAVGKQFISNSYGECINCDRRIVEFYQKYMKVGTNNMVNREDTNLVVWVLSHDDINTFGRRHYDKETFLREWDYLLHHYRADVIYYCEDIYKDEVWKENRMRQLNLKNKEV